MTTLTREQITTLKLRDKYKTEEWLTDEQALFIINWDVEESKKEQIKKAKESTKLTYKDILWKMM